MVVNGKLDVVFIINFIIINIHYAWAQVCVCVDVDYKEGISEGTGV